MKPVKFVHGRKTGIYNVRAIIENLRYDALSYKLPRGIGSSLETAAWVIEELAGYPHPEWVIERNAKILKHLKHDPRTPESMEAAE